MDSGITGHWKGDWLVELEYAITSTGSHSLILSLSLWPPPFHCTSFLFYTGLLRRFLSPSFSSYSLHLLLHAPATCLSTSENRSQLLGRSSQMCQSISCPPNHHVWLGPSRPVCSCSNGFEMSHRLKARYVKVTYIPHERPSLVKKTRKNQNNVSIKSNNLQWTQGHQLRSHICINSVKLNPAEPLVPRAFLSTIELCFHSMSMQPIFKQNIYRNNHFNFHLLSKSTALPDLKNRAPSQEITPWETLTKWR